jgi:hypothetical protein
LDELIKRAEGRNDKETPGFVNEVSVSLAVSSDPYEDALGVV